MIDLSTLQIPDVWVVPEPDEIDVREVWNLMFRPAPNKYDRVVCGLARRCRELEKRDHQASEAYAAKCETQRYLEAEIERLKRELTKANTPVGWRDK